MGISQSPKIITDGLTFNYDQYNIKSYKGPAIQNLAQTITAINTGTATGYSSTGGTETVDIPQIGTSTVAFNIIQNNYTSFSPNSSTCCPAPIGGYGGFTVSPSTLYTYAIVYRVLSGYTHPNYMYRYEYTANGGSYVTEAGVHSDSNRIHLGDGWYWAWGTFTTQATTNWFNSGSSFYYRYSDKTDKLSVAKVLIVAGNYTGLHPKYWPNVATTRSSTQAILDPINKNTVTVSSLTYANTGAISFNGSTNYMDATGSSFVSGYSAYTICYWARRTTGNRMPIAAASGTSFYWYGDNSWFYTHGGTTGEYYYPKTVTIADNSWGFFCCTYDGAAVKIYRNGVYEGQQATTGSANWSVGMRIGYWNGGSGYQWSGDIDNVGFYNRALTDAEILRNFNALRGRYGI